VLLLAGVLRRQGRAKVDGLFSAVLDRLGERATLAAQARCAGLLGAIARDLQPLDYQPADPRYNGVLEAVLQIFDAEKAESIAFMERLEAAEALGQAGDPRLNQDNWVTLEGGDYWLSPPMGDSSTIYMAGPPENRQLFAVYQDAFQIGRYPVTVWEYRKFVDGEGYRDERSWSSGGFGSSSAPLQWEKQVLHPNRPVTGVSWYEASAYCAWAGLRLPTEQEWKCAARGREGRQYPWGEQEPDPVRTVFQRRLSEQAIPVGLSPLGATPDGIEDLLGHVWQWVADHTESDERAMRGGMSQMTRRVAGAADRNRLTGFRAARSLPKP